MKKSFIAVLAAMAVAATAQTASAAPSGDLNLANAPGEGVRVTATTIDWTPLGGGTGDFTVGFGTTLAYDAGSVAAGTAGTIKDLPPAPPVASFMTFAGHPTLAFHLAALGPGAASTNCAAVTSAGDSCSVFAGSPFILTYLTDVSTTVSLFASGTATDATGVSTWTGSFSTQLNLSAEEIQDIFMGDPDAFIDSTYSGSFIASVVPVPEPASMLLLGLGLSAAAVGLRRRR